MTCDRIDKSVNILRNFFLNDFIHKRIHTRELRKNTFRPLGFLDFFEKFHQYT
jgi:hypothetical protein